MQIERYRTTDNRILNRVFNKKDEWLFIHCANGRSEVTTQVLNRHVAPMLFTHGVIMLEIVDNACKVKQK